MRVQITEARRVERWVRAARSVGWRLLAQRDPRSNRRALAVGYRYCYTYGSEPSGRRNISPVKSLARPLRRTARLACASRRAPTETRAPLAARAIERTRCCRYTDPPYSWLHSTPLPVLELRAGSSSRPHLPELVLKPKSTVSSLSVCVSVRVHVRNRL